MGLRMRYGPFVLGAVVALSGALNNVAGKIRSKPLGAYDYFVSLANAFVYTMLYWTILGVRVFLKKVPKKQFDFVIRNKSSILMQHMQTREEQRLQQLSRDVDRQSIERPLMAVEARDADDYHFRLRRWWSSFQAMWSRWGAWKYLMLTGVCDALGNIIGFISQPYISGAVFSLMNQCVVLFIVLVSMIALGERYTLWQIGAVAVVAAGAVNAVLPALAPAEWGLNGGTCHSGECCKDAETQRAQTLFFAFLTAMSTLPTAISFVTKEMIFRKYKEHIVTLQLISDENDDSVVSSSSPTAVPSTLLRLEHEERLSRTVIAPADADVLLEDATHADNEQLDIFVVAAFGSLAQLCFVPLALPLNILLGQLHGASLLQYVKDGLSCFSGVTPKSCIIYSAHCEDWGCCRYAVPTYLVYIATNLVFNTCILGLTRLASALFAFVCMKITLPISVLLFALFPWPLLSKADAGVSTTVLISLCVILMGVVLFRLATYQKSTLVARRAFGTLNGQPPCLWPLPRLFCPLGRSATSSVPPVGSAALADSRHVSTSGD